jgi:rare lipoprotein A
LHLKLICDKKLLKLQGEDMIKQVQFGFFISLFLLVGCQSTKHIEPSTPARVQPIPITDKAPSGPIPTFFKAIIPKSEALSRYGNPSSYRVYGKVYKVMPSSQGYHERGIASWYASKFHHQRTSSGEPFDMYALTAAHRTLPLPTYLKVKNLQNGREIIVKVNDRGPFHPGRLIDLSYGAAVKLGLFPKGTASVEITALPNQVQGKARRGRYFLQLGAFSSPVLANQLQTRLKKLGQAGVIVERFHGKYIVRMGPFLQRQELLTKQKWLKQHGLSHTFAVLA